MSGQTADVVKKLILVTQRLKTQPEPRRRPNSTEQLRLEISPRNTERVQDGAISTRDSSIQGKWAYVIRRETYQTSEEAHRNRQGEEYIVTPCTGRHPACPKNG